MGMLDTIGIGPQRIQIPLGTTVTTGIIRHHKHLGAPHTFTIDTIGYIENTGTIGTNYCVPQTLLVLLGNRDAIGTILSKSFIHSMIVFSV